MNLFLKTLLIFTLLGFGTLWAQPMVDIKSKQSQKNREDKEQIYEKLQSFVEVLDVIKKYYYKDVSHVKLVEGAIGGALFDLDPHSVYLSARKYKQFKDHSEGAFWGVGLEISFKKNKNLIIISPVENSPSWDAGLLTQDEILSINGVAVQGLTFSEVSNMLSSKEKTVDLLVDRKGFKVPKLFKIKKAIINIVPAKLHDLGEGYVLLRISEFTEGLSKAVSKVLKKHLKKNKEIKGLIVDLRSNPGGLLEQAIEVANLFLKKGIIVSTKGRLAESKKIFRASGGAPYVNFPMVVLQNKGSASASEVLAAALRENNRSFLVGEKSFGKGSVQSVLELENGSALKITVALFYTPKDHRIHGKGLIPDVFLKMMKEDEVIAARKDLSKDMEILQALSHLKLLAIQKESLKKHL